MEVLINTVHQLTRDLETRAPARRKAPTLPAIIIGATELAVSDPTLPLYLRGFAFYKLLKLWTSSRSWARSYFPEALGAWLKRRSGPHKDKRTWEEDRFLPIFVSNRMFLMNPAWLADGWALWADHAMNFAQDLKAYA